MTQILSDGGARLLSFPQAEAIPSPAVLCGGAGPCRRAQSAPQHPASGFPGGGARRHVVVRNDIHPALVTLLLETARDVHSGTQLFAPAGSFPNRERLDLPLHDDGARYFSRGPSFLSRYLPFGIAVWVERMIVVLIPLITILLPVMRFAPAAYRWQAQRKVYRWYN